MSTENEPAATSDAAPRGNWVIVFGNPRAGASDRPHILTNAVEKLKDAGFDVQLITSPDELTQATQRSETGRKLRSVVAAGGDGTVQLVVNRVPAGTPVSFLPMGTENLLAKYFQISAEIDDVVATVQSGVIRQFDAGRVGSQLFLIMLSCGFDAEVVRRLHEGRSGHIHHLSYAKPILDAIRNYEYPEIRVTCEVLNEQGEWESRSSSAHWAFVFNIPAYAAGLPIAKEADPNDGQLDVCTFRGGSLPAGLFHLGTVVFGQHGEWSDSHKWRVRHVHLASSAPVPIQVDGDPWGHLPVDIGVAPHRLTLLVPQ
ncbi:MAG: hypothetical protein KDA60_02310 [Planctomycetales bacterium]|nr:hypothetical protein [Planctomycetales bacterium]